MINGFIRAGWVLSVLFGGWNSLGAQSGGRADDRPPQAAHFQAAPKESEGSSLPDWARLGSVLARSVHPVRTATEWDKTVTETRSEGKNGQGNRTLFVTISGDNTICSGQSTTLTASGGNSFVWNTGATTASINVSPTVNTTYRVTATFTFGITASASRTVTVYANPNVAISGTSSICPGGSTTLTASGGGTYAWSTGATTASITVAPGATTAYTVTATNANGCTASTTRTVTVNPAAAPIISGDLEICVGGSTVLTASGGSSYAWSTGATTASITAAPPASMVYTVTATTAQGCTGTTSTTVLVYLSTSPAISVGNSICAGNQATLTATGGGSFLWSTGETTASIVVAPMATTSYVVTVSNGGGCSATAGGTVTVHPVPAISFSGPSSVCPGSPATLTASGGASYLWNNGATTASVSLIVNATTALTVIATNANGCTASASRTINTFVPPAPQIQADPQVVCWGGSSTLTATGGVAFLWNTGATTSSITVAPTATTAYSATVSDANGCTASATTTVSVNQGSVAAIYHGQTFSDSTTVCSGDTVTLVATSGSAYAWSNGASTAFIGVAPVVSTAYSVTVTTAAGCTVSASIVVVPLELPTLVLTWTDETCAGDSNATVALSHNGISFAWSNGSTDLQQTGLPPGIYGATVAGANGCSATAAATVGTVPDQTPPILSPCPSFPTQYVYNTFTIPDYWANMWATDNCVVASTVQSPSAGTVYTLSQIVWVTLTAMDASGNATQCSFPLDLRIHNCGYIYVDQTATGLNNGFNWTDAFVRLEDAIAASSSSCDTLLVAGGLYSPGPLPTSAYVLKPLVPLYGGFANGLDSVQWDFGDRDTELNPTVFDGGGVNYRVFSGNNLGADPQLSIYDGFTVQGAYDMGMFVQATGAGNLSGPIFRNVVFRDNSGNSGGGIGVFANFGGTANPLFNACTFSGNIARTQGGGLNLLVQTGSTIYTEVVDCQFLNNAAYKPGSLLARGGGMGAHAQGAAAQLTAVVTGCTFLNNSAQHGGGGLFVFSRQGAVAMVDVANCLFEGNSAHSGGGMYLFSQGGTLTTDVFQTDFTGNAVTNIGGALGIYSELNGSNVTANIENGLFTGNLTALKGGALANLGLKGGLAMLNAKKCRFDQNLATQFGSALCAESNLRSFAYPGTYTETNMENCIVYRNNRSVRGGGLYNSATNGGVCLLNLSHVTVARNNAQLGPGLFNNAVFPAQATVNLTNSVFWGNPPTAPATKLFYNLGSGATIISRYCSLQEAVFASNETGSGAFVVLEGNFAGDPMFVDLLGGDLMPQSTSPLRDAGMVLPIAEDYRGNPRPQGSAPDIGAYELGAVGIVPRVVLPAGETAEPTVDLFPNPSTGAFTLVFDHEVTGFAQVFDAQGRLVASAQLNGTGQANFDLGKVATGMYLVRVVDGETVTTKQIVVARP